MNKWDKVLLPVERLKGRMLYQTLKLAAKSPLGLRTVLGHKTDMIRPVRSVAININARCTGILTFLSEWNE